jgi:hypothetical protein
MKTKTILASMAVASLAMAQPVSAATRSVDSLPRTGVQSTAAAERVGSIGEEADELRGRPLLLILLIGGALAALILALSGGKSPG